MIYEKTNVVANLKALQDDFLEKSNVWPKHKNRICLNNHDNVDDYVLNAGQRFIYTEFNYMNSIFLNTIWEETIKLLPCKISRARIMIMKPESVLSIHRDIEPRWHLALFTDPACLFYDHDSQTAFHIPADGYFYRIDTTRVHTAFNATANFYRIHLVINEYVQ